MKPILHSRTSAVVFIAIVLPAIAGGLNAQSRPELTTDARLRVTTTTQSLRREIGTYRALTDTTLVLASGTTPVVIPLSDIALLEMSHGRKLSLAGGIGGFIVGGAAGALIGCSTNRDSYGVFCGGQSDTKVVAGALLGGAVGGGLGALLFRKESWRAIEIGGRGNAP